jgi:hypothetical protein
MPAGLQKKNYFVVDSRFIRLNTLLSKYPGFQQLGIVAGSWPLVN